MTQPLMNQREEGEGREKRVRMTEKGREKLEGNKAEVWRELASTVNR